MHPSRHRRIAFVPHSERVRASPVVGRWGVLRSFVPVPQPVSIGLLREDGARLLDHINERFDAIDSRLGELGRSFDTVQSAVDGYARWLLWATSERGHHHEKACK